MKRKHSKPPAAPQEGVPNPLARVTITEVVPDAAEVLPHLRKDPALLSRFVEASIKFMRKDLKRREAEKRGARATNLKKQHRAAADYQEYREIAERLLAKDPRLRNLSQWGWANRIAKELLRQNRSVDARTIWKALKK
jgi:hypothetical protein